MRTWLSRGFLAAVFLLVAWQTLVARSAESVAWARANELRNPGGCADYLEWADRTLAPGSGVLARFRAVVTPWVSSVEAHQRVARKCPAPVDGAWSRAP